MKIKVYTLLVMLFCSLTLIAQMPDYSKEIKEEMSKISVMAGNWEGAGWRMNPDGTKSNSNVFEHLYFKLDGTLLVLEGLGKNDNGETVHNAFGLISFDPFKKRYSMKSYLSNGLSTDADFEVIESNKSFKWWFKDNRGGTIKYNITFDGLNWSEVGEYSRDEESWVKFFEMNLKKVN